MRGVLVAGTAAEAAELTVAAAVCAVADGPAAFVASATGRAAAAGIALLDETAGAPTGGESRLFETPAPPAVAARHAGAELRPAELAAAARAAAPSGEAPLVVATSGGLLSPLAARYSNRDLAAELRLPLVLAAPAAPGLVNAAMLALEAARGSGLAVPAVVVTGWPGEPPRVLLDERELLAANAGTAVLTLPASARSADDLFDAAERWPVSDWFEAAPAAAPPPPAPAMETEAGVTAAAAAPPARVTLDPYAAWQEQPVGDPRSTARGDIMRTMLEIIAAEGPMRASRAYSLYNRASGGKKLTSVARAPLSSAIYWLAQERRVMLTRRDDIPWQDDDLVRLPDTAPVRVRELGPRTLEEVPLDEIAELATRLRAARGVADAAGLKRAILSTYGLVRLTTRADEYLTLALDLAGID